MTELPREPAGPHYDMTEPRHAGPHFGPRCPGCKGWTEAAEGFTCWTPNCPCQGMAADSAEAADAAADSARRELSAGAAAGRASAPTARARTIDGAAALEVLERRAWLELAEAYGEALTVEIAHRYED